MTIDLGTIDKSTPVEYYDPKIRHHIFSFNGNAKVESHAHSQGSLVQKPAVADMQLHVNDATLLAHDYDFNNYNLNLRHSVGATANNSVSVIMSTSNGNAKRGRPEQLVKGCGNEAIAT